MDRRQLKMLSVLTASAALLLSLGASLLVQGVTLPAAASDGGSVAKAFVKASPQKAAPNDQPRVTADGRPIRIVYPFPK